MDPNSPSTSALVGGLSIGAGLIAATAKSANYLASRGASHQHKADTLLHVAKQSNVVQAVAIATAGAATVGLVKYFGSQGNGGSTPKK